MTPLPSTDGGNVVIRRQNLLWSLQRVAMVRSAVSMLSGFVAGGLGLAVGKLLAVNKDVQSAFIIFPVGLTFSVVAWLMTKYYCRRGVPCPRCGGSLWNCGTRNFKPRRMRIRDGIEVCPHCGAAIE